MHAVLTVALPMSVLCPKNLWKPECKGDDAINFKITQLLYVLLCALSLVCRVNTEGKMEQKDLKSL